MAELPRSSKYRSTPHAPLDDGERNRLVERLNAAYEAGDVSPDEYPRLLDTVFGATTLGEVAPVVEALPGTATHDVPAIVEVGRGRPGELSEARAPSGAMMAKVAAGGVVALVLLLVVVLALLL
ncbi:MAG TPA: DUF1707 domain-containing protein [Propionibacterium sp.]|nr:DUF1707 domain-containing protein [Propionibacterium sp.]